jgi:hypothetical protein
MGKYSLKPKTVEAFVFTRNCIDVPEWAKGIDVWVHGLYNPLMNTNGCLTASYGDYIVRDESGLIYSIPAEAFEDAYEEAPDDSK